MTKLRRTALIWIFALVICALSVVQWNKTLFIFKLLQGIFAFAIVLVMVVEGITIFRSKEKLFTVSNIRNLVLSLIAISLIPVTSALVNSDGGKHVAVKAESPGPLVYATLHLYADKTFKLLHSGPIAGSYYRGDYTFRNDTLKLDNERLSYLNPTLTFVLLNGDSDEDRYFWPIHVEDPETPNFRLEIRKWEF